MGWRYGSPEEEEERVKTQRQRVVWNIYVSGRVAYGTQLRASAGCHGSCLSMLSEER